MARRQRECYLCGESYAYCGSCSQDRTKPAWMSEFHKEDCKNIFDICTRFNIGMISKVDAREELNSCDLSNKANFKSFVKRDLEIIFADEPKKRGKRAEMQIIDEAIVEPVAIKLESHEVILKENE